MLFNASLLASVFVSAHYIINAEHVCRTTTPDVLARINARLKKNL